MPLSLPTGRLRAALVLAVLATPTAPTAAHASDDFTIYSTRAAFESALASSGSGTFVRTPAASGVDFSPDQVSYPTLAAPTMYAAGDVDNLFGGSAASIGDASTAAPGGSSSIMRLLLPSDVFAFGFDYALSADAVGGHANVMNLNVCWVLEGDFCIGSVSSRGFDLGGGFLGAISKYDHIPIAEVNLFAQASALQVANLTFAGDVSTVPEPGTVVLLGSGLAALAGIGALRRRRAGAS